MLIDCDGCAVRGSACGDCVVSLLLGAGPALTGACEDASGDRSPTGSVALDQADRQALHVLAEAGLVPRLRHLPRSRAG